MRYRKIAASSALVLSVTYIFSGCGGKEEQKTELYDYKTSYIGDNTKTANIAGGLIYPEGMKYDHIEIHSDAEPYGLTVYLKNESTADKDDLFNNAVITFALIDNLDILEYRDISENTDIFNFERDEADNILSENGNKTCAEIGADRESFYGYISGLEEYK